MGYAPRPEERPALLGARGARKPSPQLRGRPQPARPDDSAAAPVAPAAADPLEAFRRDWREKTEPTRRILDHLLHQTFAGQDDRAEPESDLLLDPDPDPQTIRAVLGRYPFRDVDAAYANLNQLANEVPFLSPRRCRHFLASLAPALLRAIAETPDPDLALLNLEKVTASLGAKTVLWELFSFNTPSLKLYVDVCAWSQFLSEILINNPGMIDELLDSLVLNQPRNRVELQAELCELCKGATDLEPILHSFQDKELLRIGVRDILNKDSIRETTAALSDLAETVLTQLVTTQQAPLFERYGSPRVEQTGRPGRFAVLALGKLGARELNYHSDLDLMLVYEADGRTGPPADGGGGRVEETDNFHYYVKLAQGLIKALSQMGPLGRLYQADMRLRPTGKSGSLVLPLSEVRRYFAADGSGGAQLWERQAWTRARAVYGEPAFAAEVMAAVAEAAYGLPWRPGHAVEIAAMRDRMEASRPPLDLKRGPGGLADVEFLVQALQLKHGGERPALRIPNTWQALQALAEAGLLSEDERDGLSDGYDFLMRVQSRLRIVHNRTLDAVPEAPDEVEKLARRLGLDGGAKFLEALGQKRARTRELFSRLMAREACGEHDGTGL
jgi:glutamate-ammonia-ligase adenylyltransferase